MTHPSLKQLTELHILDEEESLAVENFWLDEMRKYQHEEDCKEKIRKRYEEDYYEIYGDV